jgi:hypothetical protein
MDTYTYRYISVTTDNNTYTDSDGDFYTRRHLRTNE